MLFLLKLTLAPALVALASLLGRRFGSRIAGWLAGFPIVAGPVLLFFALEQGTGFAAAAARQTLPGFVSLCAFCLVYNWSALRLKWWGSLPLGWLVFGVSTFLLQGLHFQLATAWLLALTALALTYKLLPAVAEPDELAASPAWDLVLRMFATASIVLILTALAKWLGPQLSGLLTPFPVASTVLVVFAHIQQGAGAVERVIKGLLLALISFSVFCVILSMRLVPWGTGTAFAVALAAAMLMQTFILLRIRSHTRRKSCPEEK